jgi:hypothetical protein
MQSLGAREREVVRQAHPELEAEEIDRLIDRLDALRVEQSLLDPEADEEAVREIGARRDELIKEKLPRGEEALRRARE